MSVQMRDVAACARVSITTVSHVLNGTRRVAPETSERVLRAVAELNYYKNASARLLARGTSDTFGLIISDIENPFFPEVIKSFEVAALDRGFETLLCTTNYQPAQARTAVRRMIEGKVRAVAVITSQFDTTLVDELVANEAPVVLLDAGGVRPGRSNIRIDYTRGLGDAIQHLCEAGHHRFSFVTGPQKRVSAVSYMRAFTAALENRGLRAEHIFEGNNRVDGGRAAAARLMEVRCSSTAVLCGNDLAAIGVMQGLREAGLRVPDDVSVVGADDVNFAAYTSPALTTVRVPRDQLGRLAVEALEKTLRTKRRTPVEFVLETSFVIRESTGAPKWAQAVSANA